MKYWVSVNGKKYEVEVERKGDYTLLAKSYESAAPIAVPAAAPAAAMPVPEAAAPVAAASQIRAKEATEKTSAEAGSLNSPFPGKVLEVMVQVGQKVMQGSTVLILEAMKMETELAAPLSGTVREIRVKAGDKVDTGELLLLISAE